MKRNRSKLKLAGAVEQPWTTLKFCSCLNTARQIEEDLLAQCQTHHFCQDDIFSIKLALEEALVNACKHGNKMDPAKQVIVSYRITDQRADVKIEDQGEGFNPAELPDPTMEENLEMTHGRGILLMRAYMSSVVFNPQGNKVTLTKFNDSFSPASTHVAAD